MQTVEPAPLQFQIRAPWKDELLRVREFMPIAFAETTPANFLIAVHGPLERIIAGAAVIPPVKIRDAARLRWRIAGARYQTRGLLVALFRRAAELLSRNATASRLDVATMVDDGSVEANAFREAGFEVAATHEVYEASAAEVWPRLDQLHQRLTSRGAIPSNAKLTHLTPGRMAEAAALMRRYLPEGEVGFTAEGEGFKTENSYVLLVDNVVKGLLFSRNHGEMTHLGAVLVTEDLRGGYRWANIALYHQSLREALDYGVKRLRFTADPELHPNTIAFAQAWEAKAIGRKLRFDFRLP